jgi:hypothetical protein
MGRNLIYQGRPIDLSNLQAEIINTGNNKKTLQIMPCFYSIPADKPAACLPHPFMTGIM